MSAVEAMKAAKDALEYEMGHHEATRFAQFCSTVDAIKLLDAAIKAAQPEPMSDERKLWLSIATPEMVSEADFIKDAAPTWDADYARIWARLQAAEANKLRWMRFARALLSAQPSGWVSVPREPTREMWDAAWNSIGLPYRAKLSMHEIKILFEKFHEAMLAAAPKEPK